MSKYPECMYLYRDHTACPHSAKYLVQWAPDVGLKLCSVHVHTGLDHGIEVFGRVRVTPIGSKQ